MRNIKSNEIKLNDKIYTCNEYKAIVQCCLVIPGHEGIILFTADVISGHEGIIPSTANVKFVKMKLFEAWLKRSQTRRSHYHLWKWVPGTCDSISKKIRSYINFAGLHFDLVVIICSRIIIIYYKVVCKDQRGVTIYHFVA